MTRIFLLILCLGFLASCDSGGGSVLQENPETDEGETDGGTDGGIDSNGRTPSLPPGTVTPTPNNQIVRREEQNDSGGGYATNIQYRNDQGQDEFFVDNIAFDGNNVYTRGDPVTGVAQLGAFAVYEGAETTEDPVTGNTLNTFVYRAIYGRSTSGDTEFAIVRSGSYIDYGFGGFIYQRNDKDFDGNSVRLVLPTEGDALYLGDYAGIRIFDGRSGLEYVQGEARMAVDFKDFNDGQRGVALFVRNRRVFDISGNDITQSYLDALSASGSGSSGGLLGDLGDEQETTGASLVISTDDQGNPILPNLRPIISPDDADANGEIAGEIQEVADYDDGTTQTTAEGTYYAIMSGEQADEIVGVLVIEGDDPRFDGHKFQETGGFIVYRQ